MKNFILALLLVFGFVAFADAQYVQKGLPKNPKFDSVSIGTSVLRTGTGSPEGAVTAPVGSVYLRSNGGAGTTLYIKESGTGNTGWIAVVSGNVTGATIDDTKGNGDTTVTWSADKIFDQLALKQNTLTNPVTGTGTNGNLAKWGASGITDGPKVGATFTDTKWCQYTTASGLQCDQDTPAGTGDVVGPASSTDAHVAVFDGITGKLLKDGGTLATDNSTAGHIPVKPSGGTTIEDAANASVDASNNITISTYLPLAGGTMTGPIAGYQLVITTTGLTQDNVYYRTSGGAWALADANGTGTYPARCYAISTTQCMVRGMYTKTSHGFTVGANLYLSDTAGGMSNTASTTTVQSLGWALDANTLVLNIGGDYAQP